VVYSIVNEDPEPPTALRSGVPMEFEQIINKALSKSPDERYQHMDELVVDLKRLKKVDEASREHDISKKIIQKSPRRSIKSFIIPIAIVLIIVIVLLFRNQIFKKEIEPIPIAVISFENQMPLFQNHVKI